MKKLVFNSVDKAKVTIDGYTFEVRGLTREEAYEFLRKQKELDDMDSEEKIEAVKEFEKDLLNTCIEDEKAVPIVLNSSVKTYSAILELIMELSGLSGELPKK